MEECVEREEIDMPERIIDIITGNLPDPLMPISWETWESFEIKKGFDTIEVEIVAALNRAGEVIIEIDEIVECLTELYQNKIGGWVAAIKIPKTIIQKYGIRLNYYLEILLLSVNKGNENIEIFPQREVFDRNPFA